MRRAVTLVLSLVLPAVTLLAVDATIAAAADIPDIRGTYSGTLSVTFEVCPAPVDNGPLTLLIDQQNGSGWTGTAFQFITATGFRRDSSVTGTVDAASMITGSFTFVQTRPGATLVSGVGSLSGQISGDVLTASGSFQDTEGDTCSGTISLSVTRQTTVASDHSPAVASWMAGRLDVFERGSDNSLRHRFFEGAWSDWENLGGVLSSDPAAVSWGPGRIDVFVKGTDDQLWHKFFDGSWSEWEPLGGVLRGGPAVASWGAGRLDVFVRGSDDQLWHRFFNGAWSAWEPLGGVLADDPAAVSWGPGRIDVFVQGSDAGLYQKFFDGTQWIGWFAYGGVLSSPPAVSSWGPGRLDVFVRGSDHGVYHLWFDQGVFAGGWESLGEKIVGTPAAVSWGPGRIDLFAPRADQAITHMFFSGAWMSEMQAGPR